MPIPSSNSSVVQHRVRHTSASCLFNVVIHNTGVFLTCLVAEVNWHMECEWKATSELCQTVTKEEQVDES